MKIDASEKTAATEADGRYAAPALEKGLDILEAICRSREPLTQREIAQQVGRSVGEIYRMLACLVNRSYLTLGEEGSYALTTRLFELVHLNPPTERLLQEATPLMQRLASEVDQSCHLTVYGQGKQVVLCKVDTPSGMGFAIRAGAEIDVLISSSGRVLLAFQDAKTRALRIEESLARRPDQANARINATLDRIRSRGYESSPSITLKGLYAVSYPILDTQGNAIAALTVPYAERIDQAQRKTVAAVVDALGATARTLSTRFGGHASGTQIPDPNRPSKGIDAAVARRGHK